MVKKRNKNKMCNGIKCKTIDVQKTKRKKKSVLGLNSNVNKRDVQTGCSGYVHKAAIRVVRI